MIIVTKEEIKEMILTGKLVKTLHQNDLPAKSPPELSTSIYPLTMLYDFSPYLIKKDTHYVPADYLFYSDNGEEKKEYIDDINSFFPKLTFDILSDKYTLEFASPDIGGYDTSMFKWYFDSKEELINELQRNFDDENNS